MSWFSTGLQAIGIGADLFSSYKGSEAVKDQASAQADENSASADANKEISDYDANVERLYANEQRYSTNQSVALHRKNLETFMSGQKTRYGKSGVSVSSGTPLEVARETTKLAMSDEYVIRHEGRKAAQTHELLAERYDMLGEKGLRDSASYSSMAISAADDKSSAIMRSGLSSAGAKAYNLATDLGWD